MSPVVPPGLMAGNFADCVHAARIAVPMIEDQRHVDVENVAVA
jgi:hypothetical protein